MNKVIDIHEARRHLSRILKDVAEGAEVVIAGVGADRRCRILACNLGPGHASKEAERL